MEFWPILGSFLLALIIGSICALPSGLLYSDQTKKDKAWEVSAMILIPIWWLVFMVVFSSMSPFITGMGFPQWKVQCKQLENYNLFRVIKTPGLIAKKEIVATFQSPDSAKKYIDTARYKYKHMNSAWR